MNSDRFLHRSLKDVVGGKTAKALENSFSIVTVGDLLHHYPRRYAERGELTSFDRVEIGQPVTIMATIASVTSRRMHSKKGSVLAVTVTDGSEFMELTFFNQKWREKELAVGRSGLFAGTVSEYRGSRTLTHPQYQLFAEGSDSDKYAIDTFAGSIIPVYPSSQAITSWQIAAAVDLALAGLGQLPDPIPDSIRESRRLLEYTEAIRLIHQPRSRQDIDSARNRLKYQEAFVLQVLLEQRRLERSHQPAVARSASSHYLRDRFDDCLPFQLTQGQKDVGHEIEDDLKRSEPMMRLLQGDVGSGKTLVALRGMLDVIEAGGQAALLAPTEVLAYQHWESLSTLVQGVQSERQINVVLLTGSQPTATRKRVLLDIASGNADLIVGTHALIQEHVDFFDLGFVVVDEQHRFGVEQRAALMNKGRDGTRPHVLIMTATPIPRTTALTTFGDLDISTLKEVPSMRAEVETFVVDPRQNPRHEARVWERMQEEVTKGNRVFIVCASISASDSESEIDNPEGDMENLFSVEDTFNELSQRFPDIVFATLHGKMHPDEKREIMQRFRSHSSDSGSSDSGSSDSGSNDPVQVLISTTVIEVGVDIPAATMMIIRNAERFGMSQLHQLRGRIGRGDKPGLCILMQSPSANDISAQRLNALCSTRDGFVLAQLDLELRGEGDVLGSDQSGAVSSLRLLRVVEDHELIEEARRDVIEIQQTNAWPLILNAIDRSDYMRASQLEKA